MNLPDRPATAEKHQWGTLTVMAGSDRYPGAAVLAVEGASRTGLDAVSFIGPKRAADEVLRRNPSSPNMALDGPTFRESDIKRIPHIWNGVVLIGPGITPLDTVIEFVEMIIVRSRRAVVLDADAILALKSQPNHKVPIIITPNHKEFHRLTGYEAREDTVAAAARDLSITILTKGPADIVSDGQRTVSIEGGSTYLAKDGTGDVLAGIVGSLVARDNDHFEACQLAARSMKRAGARAFKKHGQGMVADDIPEYIDITELFQDE